VAAARESTLALTHAIESLGGHTREDAAGLVISTPTGREVLVTVDHAGTLRTGDVGAAPDGGTNRVIVADLVPQSVRSLLASAGINWLDRRGHLHLVTDDIWIDADVPPTPRTRMSSGRRAVAGPAQIAVATAHLLGWQPGVRELARRVSLSAAAISKARAGLVAAGLITSAGEPAVPELFWALADAWTITWTDLDKAPPPAPTLVLTGTVAAVELGAPLIANADWPLEIIGRDPHAVDRAIYRAGVRNAGAPPPARIGLAPTPLVTDPELTTEHTPSGFALAHPLFVALELAQDPARGAEALESWHPAGFDRVW
jgi:hypothetical protein